MNTNDFFKSLEEKGFDTQKLDVANLRNYLSVVSEDHKREYSEVMRLMQHKEELGFLGYGDDVMLEFIIEPSDNGVTPGIHIDLLTVTDSSKEEYIRLNDVPYAHEDYIFYNVFECDSMEEFVGSVEELQTNIWPKYLKNTVNQEQKGNLKKAVPDKTGQQKENEDMRDIQFYGYDKKHNVVCFYYYYPNENGKIEHGVFLYHKDGTCLQGDSFITANKKWMVEEPANYFDFDAIVISTEEEKYISEDEFNGNVRVAHDNKFFIWDHSVETGKKIMRELAQAGVFNHFDAKTISFDFDDKAQPIDEFLNVPYSLEDYQKSLEKAKAFDENLDNEKLIEFFNKKGQGFPRQPHNLGEVYFGENYNTALSLTIVGGDEPVLLAKVMSRTDSKDDVDTTAYIPNVGNIQYEDIALENMPINDYQDLDSVFNYLKVTYPSHFKSPIHLSVYPENKDGISLEEAGNWQLNGKEFGSVVFGEREIPPEGVYLGHVGYGNSIVQLHCVPNNEESKEGQLRVSVEQFLPTLNALDARNPETNSFHLAGESHVTLWTDCVGESPAKVTDFYCYPSKVSIDSFKEEAVAKMVEAEIISPDRCMEYKQLTDKSMDFASQVFEQDEKIKMFEEFSSKIRPVETIRKEKLSPDDISMLSVYYDQIAEFLSDRNGLGDATERIVNVMKKDGLDNARIGLVFKASEKLRDCLMEKGLSAVIHQQPQQGRVDNSKVR